MGAEPASGGYDRLRPPSLPLSSSNGAGDPGAVSRSMCSTCRAWKNAASEAANVATAVMAQTSSTMSSTRPAVVTGFGICELTVGSCAETQNSAPPKWSKPEP